MSLWQIGLAMLAGCVLAGVGVLVWAGRGIRRSWGGK